MTGRINTVLSSIWARIYRPDTSQRVDENIIRGCQSQVWLVHEFRDNTLHFAMDSDAHIVRGRISIVLIALNDRSPEEIL